MTIPTDRKYLDTHEWHQVEGNVVTNVVTIGITRFAADELTDITFVDLPPVGTVVEEGGEIGEIESVKATSELVTAIGGEIIEINQALADAPELVNSDPFDAGWMVKIKADDLAPLERLMDAAAYQTHCATVSN